MGHAKTDGIPALTGGEFGVMTMIIGLAGRGGGGDRVRQPVVRMEMPGHAPLLRKT